MSLDRESANQKRQLFLCRSWGSCGNQAVRKKNCEAFPLANT